MATRISTNARNASVNAVAALADAGAGAAVVRIYSGSQPASAQDAPSGTLLITFTLSDPSFGAGSSGTITALSMPKSANAVATDTAGWGRLLDSNGNGVFDGGVNTSGAEFTISSTSIINGSPYNLTGLSYTQPAG